MEDSYPARPQQETGLCTTSQLCFVRHTGTKLQCVVTGISMTVTQSVTYTAFRITHGMYALCVDRHADAIFVLLQVEEVYME